MKRIPAILFFIGIVAAASGQRIIKGRVVNETTGAAVQGSSVFITNTSKGTVTDNAGNFEITDVPAGKHDLIISSIGYETNVFTFETAQLPLQLKIQLAIKVKELDNVVLEPSVEEGWDKWGRMFMENFIGKTSNASQCKIKNEQAIRFRRYNKSNRVVALCDEPILIENKALGYTISYQLENFEVNFSKGTTFFLGYSLFVPMTNLNRQDKWKKNRRAAFNGSIMHFMRSLYADSLLAEGFEVRRMVRTPNYEKQRVRAIYQAGRMYRTNGQTGMTVITRTDSVDGRSGDSAKYYDAVLRQPEYTETFGRELLGADSLIIETQGAYRVLHFNDFLFITYRNELEDKEYTATQFPVRKPGLQRSYVTLLGNKIISLDYSGNYYDPRDFFTSAYWGWSEKMANSLPLDYEPDE
jgi:CarboxypepD_reg-like domain